MFIITSSNYKNSTNNIHSVLESDLLNRPSKVILFCDTPINKVSAPNSTRIKRCFGDKFRVSTSRIFFPDLFCRFEPYRFIKYRVSPKRAKTNKKLNRDQAIFPIENSGIMASKVLYSISSRNYTS